ncbi:hypothetical protein [Corynebacterium sp.]|uniref:hypothetical protein n=1 Tax=Corynebacterium sp. TaxID=1720 RepID=UPI0026E0F962|nr:hypothetical protein [Corynebacterium sp.]MDO5511313.1 hypothetical protein [Corynebacterium sp.]
MEPDTRPFAFGRDGVLVFATIGAMLAAWFWYGQEGGGWIAMVWMLAVSWVVLFVVFSTARWAFNRLFAWGARRTGEEDS